MTLLCVIPGPSKLIKIEPDDGPNLLRWCFLCRRRRLFYWRLMGDPFPSYYDPVWIRTCAGCGKDGSRFPASW